MPEPYLAPPEELATLTKLEASNPSLLLALDRASERFRQAVGHPVHHVVGDEIVLDGDGTETLLLPAAPFTDITILVGGAAVTDFEANRRGGVLRRKARWPDGLGNIEITYTHGYAVIPGGIRDAVLEQAVIQLKVPAGVQSESAGGQSITWGVTAATGVTQKWAEAVEVYRLGRGDRP
jgi:hypothetical protein